MQYSNNELGKAIEQFIIALEILERETDENANTPE